MNINSKHSTSAHMNSDFVEATAKEAEADGLKTINPEQCGYVLVDNSLVPLTFIERVKTELAGSYFEYGEVLSESALFGDAFLLTLNDDERAVLMPSVLFLIERDVVWLSLFEERDELAA